MAFRAVEGVWVERLGKLRNVVRQELIARQVAGYGGAGRSVLDVGCGQGTQALRLAAQGCRVTGVDPSAELLERFRSAADAGGHDVELVQTTIEGLDEAMGGRTFDLVCAHGLLMYLDDAPGAIATLARHVAPGGHLSITVRNACGLAFRPAMRGDWRVALAAFDARDYVNELGASARADDLAEVETWLGQVGLEVVEWFGVRVFTDPVDPETLVPAPEDLTLLLVAEEEAGRRDPYRSLASQLHLLVNRPR